MILDRISGLTGGGWGTCGRFGEIGAPPKKSSFVISSVAIRSVWETVLGDFLMDKLTVI